ncbi:MAG: nitroreductase family protein [Armatimonadota bacterium]|nr:MAG: nitroreductase family protein [Armatimonadota bacterium]
MGNIGVDLDKCVACGACVEECPAYVFSMAEDGASVVAEERCIVCGHCVAVCPEDAVSHRGLAGTYDAFDAALAVDPAAAQQLIRSRRSIRCFTEDPVSDDDLATLLNAAVYAPSAHNDQPWQFAVIRGRDKLSAVADAAVTFMHGVLRQLDSPQGREALAAALPPAMFETLKEIEPSLRLIVAAHRAGNDIIFRGATALIVIHAPRAMPSGVEDAHYAAANIMLMAHAMNLGTCLIGYLAGPARYSRDVAAAAGVPPENELCVALVVGHPKHSYPRIVPRRQAPIEWL